MAQVSTKRAGNTSKYLRKTPGNLTVRSDYVNWGGVDCLVVASVHINGKYMVKLAGREYTHCLIVKPDEQFYVRPEQVDDQPAKRRGRPKGSKNKKSLTTS